MQSGWRIGSLFKIPLFIDPSWFLIVAWITFRDGLVWQQSYPTWSALVAYGAGFVMALLLFGSVLLHELGHSLVAKSKGIEVNSIRLFLFGGVASIDKEPQKPADMLQVAIAGPLVSLFLWVALTALLLFVRIPSQPLAVVLSSVAALNFTLLMFNLIPGLPLDGGQMLKAIVWKFSGNYVTGAHWAAKTGLWLGWAVTAVGFADVLGITARLGLPEIGGIWAILIGWFMRQNAANADRFTDVQEALLNLAAKDAMTRNYRVLDAEMSLRQFAEELVLQTGFTGQYFAASDGRYRGLITIEQLQQVERSLWETKTLKDLAQPLTAIAAVNETTPMVDLIRQMERESLNRITVLSPAGAVAGVIDRADITRAVGEKLGFPIAPTVLQQIRETGAYPPGLQLGAIADMITSIQITPEATAKNAEPTSET
jgi:Zn-dependent protease/CBS domain-containing protein